MTRNTPVMAVWTALNCTSNCSRLKIAQCLRWEHVVAAIAALHKEYRLSTRIETTSVAASKPLKLMGRLKGASLFDADY